MAILDVGIDCVDDFSPPYGTGTKDALINPVTRMIRFPVGDPPPKGTTICVTYEGLCPAVILSQDTAKSDLEGQKGFIADVSGLTTDQAQSLLDNQIFNPNVEFSIADQHETVPMDETPPTIPTVPTIPKIGTPIKTPVPKVPQIPNFPFPPGNSPSGDGVTEQEDSKDAKGKHSSKVKTGPQTGHLLEDNIADQGRRQIKGAVIAKHGISGTLNVINGGAFAPAGPFVPRVFVP